MRKTIITLIVAVSVLIIGGCDSFKKEPPLSGTPEQIERARVERSIAANFQDSDAHYRLGQMYLMDRLLSKAEYEFNLAIGFDPLNRDAQAAHVKVFKVMGNKEKSAQLAELYMSQVNTRAEDGLLLGRAFQSEGLDDYALACYEKALTLAPNSAVLNKNIGLYYLNKNDRARAESYLRRSIQEDPYQSDVAGELGKMGVRIEVPRKPYKGQNVDAMYK